VTITIRPAGDADLEAVVDINAAATPEFVLEADALRHGDRTFGAALRLLAEDEDEPVGAATIGRIYMLPPDYDALWATVWVLPAYRRRGTGGRLLDALGTEAAARGKRTLHVPVREDREDAMAFFRRRGFAEHERSKAVRLDLAGVAPPVPAVPDGVTLTSIAKRPDLATSAYDAAIEAYPDVPSTDEPMSPGTFEEWFAYQVDWPGVPQDAFVIAVADDKVVAYASLVPAPRRPVGYHTMTLVRPGWRGHGIGLALKQAQIRWAIEAGLEALETENDVDNAPMRAINAGLGYRPLPDVVTLRGPAAGSGSRRIAGPRG
jgi:GNAT superfamily N-acetyltransferase